MSQPTPLRPLDHRPQGVDLDTALAEVRRIAETPVPLPRSARFNIDTALTLAEKAPELYAMGDGTRGRFTLIATFLRDALAEIDQPVQR